MGGWRQGSRSIPSCLCWFWKSGLEGVSGVLVDPFGSEWRLLVQPRDHRWSSRSAVNEVWWSWENCLRRPDGALFRLLPVFGASGRAARGQLMLSSGSEPFLLVLAAQPPDSGGSAGSALSRAWWCWQSSLGRIDFLSCSSERCLVGLRLDSDLTFPIILEPK